MLHEFYLFSLLFIIKYVKKHAKETQKTWLHFLTLTLQKLRRWTLSVIRRSMPDSRSAEVIKLRYSSTDFPLLVSSQWHFLQDWTRCHVLAPFMSLPPRPATQLNHSLPGTHLSSLREKEKKIFHLSQNRSSEFVHIHTTFTSTHFFNARPVIRAPGWIPEGKKNNE